MHRRVIQEKPRTERQVRGIETAEQEAMRKATLAVRQVIAQSKNPRTALGKMSASSVAFHAAWAAIDAHRRAHEERAAALGRRALELMRSGEAEVGWLEYWVSVDEPGYIAVHCYRDEVWDQFPMQPFGVLLGRDGQVDLKWLLDWCGDHEARYHPVSPAGRADIGSGDGARRLSWSQARSAL